MSAVFALLASLVWGSSDYLGGMAARRLPVAWIIFLGQTCALVILLVGVTALGLWRYDDGIAWGAAAGVIGPIALAAFYTALSTGTMGVVAPVASCGVMVPVVVGVAEGEQPGPLQVIGIVVTIAGVILAGRSAGGPTAAHDAHARRGVLLALVAALGFGVVLACVAEGSRSSTGTTLTVQRLVSVVLVGLVLLKTKPPLRTQPPLVAQPRLSGQPRVHAGRPDLARAVASGVGDAGANALYAEAVTGGLVSVNAVLSSLYPIVTALLARQLDRERLSRTQAAGVSHGSGRRGAARGRLSAGGVGPEEPGGVDPEEHCRAAGHAERLGRCHALGSVVDFVALALCAPEDLDLAEDRVARGSPGRRHTQTVTRGSDKNRDWPRRVAYKHVIERPRKQQWEP